jgi:Putative DNA-binding domain
MRWVTGTGHGSFAHQLDDLSERDLLDQIQAGVPEGVLVGYKRDMYGRTDADIREFLKDVSSFANTAGGHLIIGMDEAAGIPTAITPLIGIDSDQELQRLENMARDGLEPRVAGLRMKAVQINSGGIVIVLRVPKSFNPPHRVSARNTNRIYGRNSAGAYEFSVEELRVIFTSAATALDRVRAFRAERLARIDSGEAIAPLTTDLGRLVLDLVPVSAFGLSSQIDLEQAYAAQDLLRPLAAVGFTPRINFDGFANLHEGVDGRCWSYTQIFGAAPSRLLKFALRCMADEVVRGSF